MGVHSWKSIYIDTNAITYVTNWAFATQLMGKSIHN